MISIGYVNNTLTPMTDMLFREYSDEINDIYDNTNNICYEMSLLEERVNIEQEITGSVDDTLVLEYEEKKKNFFQKIGEAIITIFEKIRTAIQSAIDKIKEIAFGSKSDLQKLDTHPNTLKGKWEKAKKKFNEDEKTWKIVKVGAAATTVITAIKAVATFNGALRRNRDELQESNAKNRELEAELEKRLRDEGAIKAADPSTGKGGTGRWTALLQITRERNGYHDAARMQNLTLIEKIQNGIAKFLDKFTPKSQTELFNDYETERQIKKEQEKSEAKKKKKAAKKEAYAKAAGTLQHKLDNSLDYQQAAKR